MTYAHTAIDLTGERRWLGMQLTLEAWRRSSWTYQYPAAAAAGDCLDAPNILPAGGCRSFEFDDPDMPAIVEQIVCERS